MAQSEGIKAGWKRLVRFLDAMAGGSEFDLHKEYRARFAAIDARLDSIEKNHGPASQTAGDEGAPVT